MSEDRMMKWFEYKDLPDNVRAVGVAYSKGAMCVVEDIEPGPERTVALRKLLESREAAIRAKANPGG